MKARVIYVDLKKSLAYVQVESKSSQLQEIYHEELIHHGQDRNIMNLTYKIDKSKIRVKQIMPSSYEESLLYLQGKRTLDAM